MVMETQRFSLYTAGDVNYLRPSNSVLNVENLCRYMHGYIPSIDHFALRLSKLVIENAYKYPRLLVCSSPYFQVKPSSSLLLQKMKDFYLPLTMREETRILIKEPVPFNYELLPSNDKIKTWKSLNLRFEKNKFDENTLIVIADTFVSDEYEKDLQKLLRGTVKRIQFYYIIDYSADPESYQDLCQFQLKETDPLNKIVRDPNYQFTKEALYLILKSAEKDVEKFMKSLTNKQKSTLVRLIKNEGINHFTSDDQNRISLLESLIFGKQIA